MILLVLDLGFGYQIRYDLVMPTYEYQCDECSHRVEVFAAMSDPPPPACEECGSEKLSKVLFPVAIHYKGSGFYSTDYAGKKSGAAKSEGGSTKAESEATKAESSDKKKTSGSDASTSSKSKPVEKK